MAKIFFLKFPLEDSLGGAEFHTLKLALHFQKLGHEIKLLTSDQKLFRLFEKNGLPRKRLWVGFEPTSKWSLLAWPLTYFIARRIFKKLISEISPGNILFMQSLTEKLVLSPLTLYPSPSGRGGGVRIFWLEHKTPGRWIKSNPLKYRYLKLVKKVQIITVSNFAKQGFVKLGVPPENIKVIYPGVSPSPGLRPPYPSGRGEGVRIGLLSRLDPEKGVLDFLKGLIPQLEKHPEWKIIIGGEGEEEEVIRKLIYKNNLQNQIRLLGFVENLDDYFAQLSVFVYPTKVPESFGISILEAMARGIPVISTKIGATPELIEDKKTGYLVDSGKSGVDLFKVLLAAEVYKNISQNALTRALEFTETKMLDRFTELVRI